MTVMWDEARGSTATVNQARVNHVARCRSRDKATFLDVVQVQEMEIQEVLDGDVSRLTAVSYPSRQVIHGHFPFWYEASISSVKAEGLFMQNENLKHGEQTAWTLETFHKDKIVDHLVHRATEVAKRINGVGVFCNNRLGDRYGLEVDESSGAVTPLASYYPKKWYNQDGWFF